jgi:uncharacterized membrane protein
MKKRPLSITIISWLFMAVGSIALVYHLAEAIAQHRFEQGLVWVCCVRLLAIVSGVFMLRGFNWARWLLIVWLAYHVVLSAFHSPMEVVVHGLLLGVVAYFLFRPSASAYFRRG